MDIRKDGQQHVSSASTLSAKPAPELMDIKQHRAGGTQSG
jgi:hypothetical protein